LRLIDREESGPRTPAFSFSGASVSAYRSEKADRFWEIAEPLAMQEGFEIVDVEYRAEGGGMTLRFFVDRDGGVTVDDLSRLSRELRDVLEVHGPGDAGFALEVSSPGVNRRLTRPAHFERYVGRRVRVRTEEPVLARRNFLGILTAASDAEIALRLEDGAIVQIPLAAIARANYEHDFDAERRDAVARRRVKGQELTRRRV
jgi:ribosome maturation factor RimP